MEDHAAQSQTTFTNVQVFDGVNENRIENANVLDAGNLSKQISIDPIEGGALSVEHGLFIEEEMPKLMAEKGVLWSMQPMDAAGEIAFKFESSISTAKYEY